MGESTAIKVVGLGKKYVLGGAEKSDVSFREMLTGALTAPLRRLKRLQGARTEDETFWALKDVNFDIKPGEVVGIIGRNGAGKSTLLKILSRITDPTEGRIEIRGRVSSLLEVGTGFHPELTGRENIFLNGAILGMTRQEIRNKFDEIVAFAEVEKFLDTPVKRYSSGMYVRLAFAVAAHLDPEILIVDEVLAVGDAEFQKKCMGKMQNAGKEGRTVIFVSHNMGAVRSLCSKGFLLDKGTIVNHGEIKSVVDAYLFGGASGQLSTWVNKETDERDCDIRLVSVRCISPDGHDASDMMVDKPIEIEINYLAHKPLTGVRLIVQLQTRDGSVIFTSCDDSNYVGRITMAAGRYKAICRIPPNLLNIKQYSVFIGIDIPRIKIILPLIQTVEFNIIETSSLFRYQPPQGFVRPLLDWSNVQMETDDGAWQGKENPLEDAE